MDNKGKLLEAWVATCSLCEKEIFLKWDNGTNMSRSQARHILINEYSWLQTTPCDDWVCSECRSD